MSKYLIRPGDTLSALAVRYHTTVDALARANKIKNPDLIYAGKTLTIPGSKDEFQPAKSGGRSSRSGGSGKPSRTGGGKDTSGTRGTGGTSGASGKVSATMRRLAAAGRAAAMSMGGYVSHGLCATGVSKALRNALGITVYGNGNQIDNNLPRSKFKQVNMSLAEALKIPGLVLTWEHTSTRLGSIYGHTAITTGDGSSSCSDFIERNTLAGAAGRSGLKIFMPIG